MAAKTKKVECKGGTCGLTDKQKSAKFDELVAQQEQQEEFALAILVALMPALTMTLFNVMGLF